MKIGSLFHGTGALDLAVQRTWGGELAWLAENDRNVARISAWNSSGVRNVGDATRADWRLLESVDVLTGGSPCQDLSHAGKHLGFSEGTRSNLWVQMRNAIDTIRPSLVVWENVRGAYISPADSELEFCPGCMGDERERTLRALGRVLGDLADLGYDARWHGMSASEVGAPHGRWRVFLLAYPQGSAPPDPLDSGPGQCGPERNRGTDTHVQVHPVGVRRGNWGRYGPSVRTWERLTRPHPPPLDESGRITAGFVEWMMGLPQGWVTAVPGMERDSAIRAIGNSVLPRQAEAAFRLMCSWSRSMAP